MSFVTLRTRDLVGLLADAVLTASTDPECPVLRAVLLDTAHGEVEVQSEDDDGEPPLLDVVSSDLLVATSTDGSTMISQCHVACTGHLQGPMLLPALDVLDLVKVFTRLGKTAPKGLPHETRLELVGSTLTVSEDPSLCPDGRVMQLQVLDTEDYPRALAEKLRPATFGTFRDQNTGKVIDPSYGWGLSASASEVVGKVGKRRKMPDTRWYQDHPRRGVVVEVGSMWSARFKPGGLEDVEYLAPQIPVFEPRLPE